MPLVGTVLSQPSRMYHLPTMRRDNREMDEGLPYCLHKKSKKKKKYVFFIGLHDLRRKRHNQRLSDWQLHDGN